MPRKMWLPLLTAIIGLVLAMGSVASVVPRIRLVEAVGLFATAFGAGAGAAATVVAIKRARREPSA